MVAENVKSSGWWRSAPSSTRSTRARSPTRTATASATCPASPHASTRLASLGVDAIWLSPFFTSPQNDAGYDVADYCDVDPLFGTLDDFDRLLAEPTRCGIRVIVDLVPNHTSSQHEWFKEALAAAPAAPNARATCSATARAPNGELPPNNWESVFGGPAWTRVTDPTARPASGTCTSSTVSQPDLDWTNEWVREQFRDILRFWLDRASTVSASMLRTA